MFRFSRSRSAFEQMGSLHRRRTAATSGASSSSPTPPGNRLIAGSDRDFGLLILRYTGPGAPALPSKAAPKPPVVSPAKPSNQFTFRLNRLRNGRLPMAVSVKSAGRISVAVRAAVAAPQSSWAVAFARKAVRTKGAGRARFTVTLSRGARRWLKGKLKRKRNRRLRGSVTVSFRPTGGTARAAKRKITISDY